MRVVAVDTGGTFTDFIQWRGEDLVVLKVPSTPEDPASAVIQGLQRLCPGGFAGLTVLYGTTVATNAVLERRGATVALLTTAGFEDVLELARQDRPDIYALEPRRRAPLWPPPRRPPKMENSRGLPSQRSNFFCVKIKFFLR